MTGIEVFQGEEGNLLIVRLLLKITLKIERIFFPTLDLDPNPPVQIVEYPQRIEPILAFSYLVYPMIVGKYVLLKMIFLPIIKTTNLNGNECL